MPQDRAERAAIHEARRRAVEAAKALASARRTTAQVHATRPRKEWLQECDRLSWLLDFDIDGCIAAIERATTPGELLAALPPPLAAPHRVKWAENAALARRHERASEATTIAAEEVNRLAGELRSARMDLRVNLLQAGDAAIHLLRNRERELDTYIASRLAAALEPPTLALRHARAELRALLAGRKQRIRQEAIAREEEAQARAWAEAAEQRERVERQRREEERRRQELRAIIDSPWKAAASMSGLALIPAAPVPRTPRSRPARLRH